MHGGLEPQTWGSSLLCFPHLEEGRPALRLGQTINSIIISTVYWTLLRAILSICIFSLNPHSAPMRWVLLATCHTVAQMAKPGFNLGVPEPRACGLLGDGSLARRLHIATLSGNQPKLYSIQDGARGFSLGQGLQQGRGLQASDPHASPVVVPFTCPVALAYWGL